MQTASSAPSSSIAVAPPVGPLEFLSFALVHEEYEIDIQKAQELRGYDAVARIADAPEHLKDVMDMRIKFNLGAPTPVKTDRGPHN
jgi:purine-binding chemotaxis protein CheW